jgi:hypothetical protein
LCQSHSAGLWSSECVHLETAMKSHLASVLISGAALDSAYTIYIHHSVLE